MSDISTATIACPACATGQEVTLYRSVNVSLYPDLKPKLMQQELTRPKCRSCGTVLLVNGPLLYHDMDKKLMVWSLNLGPDAGAPGKGMQGYTLRTVRTVQQLIEKVLIFDRGLDDRAVEAVKYGVCHDLLTQYADTLAKFNALPLNVGRILFLDRLSIGVGRQPVADQFLFLFLLVAPPGMNVFCLLAPATAYQAAEARLRERQDAELDPRRWHTIDFDWSRKVFGDAPIPLEVQMVAGPALVEQNPVGQALARVHSEMILEAVRTARPRRSGGIVGWIRRQFGGQG